MLPYVRRVGLLTMIAAAAPAFAQSFVAGNITAPHTRDERSLLAAEDARMKATLAHDPAGIAAGLADELIYTHASGKVQSKADILANAGRPGPNAEVAISGRIVRVFGEGGMTRADRVTKLGAMTLRDSYLGVYVKRDGRWQLIAWQTSPTQKLDAGNAAVQTMGQPAGQRDPVSPPD